MFDVDGTLSLARQSATPEMLATLRRLRDVCAIAFVGGSDLVKIREQLESGPASDGEWQLDLGCSVDRIRGRRYGGPLQQEHEPSSSGSR
jgi:phosphomannomutase